MLFRSPSALLLLLVCARGTALQRRAARSTRQRPPPTGDARRARPSPQSPPWPSPPGCGGARDAPRLWRSNRGRCGGNGRCFSYRSVSNDGTPRPAQPHQPETGPATGRTLHRRGLKASPALGSQPRNGGRSQHARRSWTPKLLLPRRPWPSTGSSRQRVRLSAATATSDGQRTTLLRPRLMRHQELQ